jgi:hypothetical protein
LLCLSSLFKFKCNAGGARETISRPQSRRAGTLAPPAPSPTLFLFPSNRPALKKEAITIYSLAYHAIIASIPSSFLLPDG